MKYSVLGFLVILGCVRLLAADQPQITPYTIRSVAISDTGCAMTLQSPTGSSLDVIGGRGMCDKHHSGETILGYTHRYLDRTYLLTPGGVTKKGKTVWVSFSVASQEQ